MLIHNKNITEDTFDFLQWYLPIQFLLLLPNREKIERHCDARKNRLTYFLMINQSKNRMMLVIVLQRIEHDCENDQIDSVCKFYELNAIY